MLVPPVQDLHRHSTIVSSEQCSSGVCAMSAAEVQEACAFIAAFKVALNLLTQALPDNRSRHRVECATCVGRSAATIAEPIELYTVDSDRVLAHKQTQFR